MTFSFLVIAILTIASAVAAMSLRQLVHCALALTLTFAGLAALYLQLQAQFVGLAQVLVYVGAVAILIVFAILLTRGSDLPVPASPSLSALWGGLLACAVFAVLAFVLVRTRLLTHQAGEVTVPTVKQIGDELMTRYVLPLEVVGLLLTAALIGAVILAMPEKEGK